jgi:hypothetical protein
VLCLSLLACSAPPRIYSRHPVDRDGKAIPVQRATKLVFEDGTSYTLTDKESASLRKDTVRVSGSEFGTAVWSLGQVEGVVWKDADGKTHWADVRTPEDLRAFVSLPPIDRIRLDDGSLIQLEPEGLQARLDTTGLHVLVAKDGDWENARKVELTRVESVELHEPNLLGATIRSPMFWLAGVASGVAIYLVTRDGDPDVTAVR